MAGGRHNMWNCIRTAETHWSRRLTRTLPLPCPHQGSRVNQGTLKHPTWEAGAVRWASSKRGCLYMSFFIQQASRALPSHGGTAASSHSRQGLVIPHPPPRPLAGEAGTLVLAPECNIPEPPTFLPTRARFLAAQERAGASGCWGGNARGWGRGRPLPPTRDTASGAASPHLI